MISLSQKSTVLERTYSVVYEVLCHPFVRYGEMSKERTTTWSVARSSRETDGKRAGR